MQEERLRQECTFKPELSARRAGQEAEEAAAAIGRRTDSGNAARGKEMGYVVSQARSRYREAAVAVAAAVTGTRSSESGAGDAVWGSERRGHAGKGKGTLDLELEMCTFSPTVIGVRKGMGNAQQYLKVCHPLLLVLLV